jgi:integrase
MGTIQIRHDNAGATTFQARIRRKGFPTLSRTFPTDAAARNWMAYHEAHVQSKMGALKLETERQRMVTECAPQYKTFGDLMRRYLASVSPTKRGFGPESLRMKGLLKHSIAACPVGALSRARIADWRDKRLLTVSGSTVRRDIALLSHVVEIAIMEWDLPLDKNPFRKVRKPKDAPPRERRLEAGEEARLVAACAEARVTYLTPLVQLALETAMRQGELVGLDWSRVNLAARSVYLIKTKNGKSRGIPLSLRAIAVLEALPDERRGQVFAGTTTESVKQSFTRARNRAGMPDFRFHDLRHEAISRLIEKGLSIPEAARITGHTTWAMLQRYTHLQMGDLARRLD